MFTNKKRAGINTFACAVSLYVAETPKASIKDHEPPLPIIPFDLVAYGFVGQTFSKQLYIADLKMRSFDLNQEAWKTLTKKNCLYLECLNDNGEVAVFGNE